MAAENFRNIISLIFGLEPYYLFNRKRYTRLVRRGMNREVFVAQTCSRPIRCLLLKRKEERRYDYMRRAAFALLNQSNLKVKMWKRKKEKGRRESRTYSSWWRLFPTFFIRYRVPIYKTLLLFVRVLAEKFHFRLRIRMKWKLWYKFRGLIFTTAYLSKNVLHWIL